MRGRLGVPRVAAVAALSAGCAVWPWRRLRRLRRLRQCDCGGRRLRPVRPQVGRDMGRGLVPMDQGVHVDIEYLQGPMKTSPGGGRGRCPVIPGFPPPPVPGGPSSYCGDPCLKTIWKKNGTFQSEE